MPQGGGRGERLGARGTKRNSPDFAHCALQAVDRTARLAGKSTRHSPPPQPPSWHPSIHHHAKHRQQLCQQLKLVKATHHHHNLRVCVFHHAARLEPVRDGRLCRMQFGACKAVRSGESQVQAMTGRQAGVWFAAQPMRNVDSGRAQCVADGSLVQLVERLRSWQEQGWAGTLERA